MRIHIPFDIRVYTVALYKTIYNTQIIPLHRSFYNIQHKMIIKYMIEAKVKANTGTFSLLTCVAARFKRGNLRVGA